MKKIKIIFKWCAVSLVAVFILLIGLFVFSFSYNPETILLNQDQVNWLPKEASHISFYKRKGFGWIKAYNCKIPKKHFYSFAKKNNWQMANSKKQIVITQPKILDKMQIIQSAMVFYDIKKNNGGTRVVYDLDNELLYVTISHR